MVVNVLRNLEIAPTRVLEIGCSNGTRLNDIQSAFGSKCFGIDPSDGAVAEGNQEFPGLDLHVGTAESLPFADDAFDLVIFGFCLCYCDRSDLFKVAMEADRCLSNNGHLVVLDFLPPFPYRNTYAHKEGMYVYKMDYSHLFEWNPAYNRVNRVILGHAESAARSIPDERIAVTVLHKSEKFAYPTSCQWEQEGN